MALFSNLFRNTTFQPISKISSIFTLPFQILKNAIEFKVSLIDKIFDPFNLFDINQLNSKDSVFKKIAELAQHDQALTQPTALRSSLINILNAKSGVLGIPSNGISGIADKIQQALSGGKLFGTIDSIIKKVQNIFDFGTIFETPKAVFEKIAELIGGGLSNIGGSLIDTIGKLIKSASDLFNLPSLDTIISKIQEYIDLGVIFDGVENLVGKIQDIFDFGSILDTPKAVIGKIAELISGGLAGIINSPLIEQIAKIIEDKLELFGLPSIEEIVGKIQEYIDLGAIYQGIESIIKTLQGIFDGDSGTTPPGTNPPPGTGGGTPPINEDSIYEIFDNTIIVDEKPNAGIDTVNSHISYTLTANVENLALQGTADLNGTGNELDNMITGNSGSNTLSGLAGNDTIFATAGLSNILIGGTGNDTLYGSVGNETYEFELGFGQDTILDFDGDDKIKFGQNINYEDILITDAGENRFIEIEGTTDSIIIKDWAKGEQNQIESIQLANGDRIDLKTLELQANYYY